MPYSLSPRRSRTYGKDRYTELDLEDVPAQHREAVERAIDRQVKKRVDDFLAHMEDDLKRGAFKYPYDHGYGYRGYRGYGGYGHHPYGYGRGYGHPYGGYPYAGLGYGDYPFRRARAYK